MHRFGAALAAGEQHLVVGARFAMEADARSRDRVQRPVELAIAAAVEAVAAERA